MRSKIKREPIPNGGNGSPTLRDITLMAKYDLKTEITRSPADIFPSVYELYFKHFNDSIYFVYHTGITDRYGSQYEAEDDDDNEDLPGIGLEHLGKETKAFLEFTNSDSSLSEYVEDITTYKFANFEGNVFICFLIMPTTKTIVQIRISPARRRTMTAFTILSDLHDRPGIDKLISYAAQFIAPPPTKKDKIHIITQSSGDFYLKDITLKDSRRQQFSYDHYNEDFEQVSERIITTLQNDNESGLVLFHGDPGTGKTSYLKHLLHTIGTKKLIYMPPDLTEHLSSPGFITFMMSEAVNSILLIEDAENVLRHREAGGNQAVSNILNLSDGILGDVLKLQIVCTFNSKLEEIDPALLRPGRCIAEYRFEKLSVDSATNLMDKLHGADVPWAPKEMTLAEVFNFKKPKDRTKSKKRGVGFTAQLEE